MTTGRGDGDQRLGLGSAGPDHDRADGRPWDDQLGVGRYVVDDARRELVGADLHDAHDAMVDVQTQLEHRERLHVADDLLGRLARFGQNVDLVGDRVRTGHDAGSDDPG